MSAGQLCKLFLLSILFALDLTLLSSACSSALRFGKAARILNITKAPLQQCAHLRGQHVQFVERRYAEMYPSYFFD